MNPVNGLVALPSVSLCHYTVLSHHRHPSSSTTSVTISVSGYPLYSTLLSLVILAVFKTRVTYDPAIMVNSTETNLHL